MDQIRNLILINFPADTMGCSVYCCIDQSSQSARPAVQFAVSVTRTANVALLLRQTTSVVPGPPVRVETVDIAPVTSPTHISFLREVVVHSGIRSTYPTAPKPAHANSALLPVYRDIVCVLQSHGSDNQQTSCPLLTAPPNNQTRCWHPIYVDTRTNAVITCLDVIPNV